MGGGRGLVTENKSGRGGGSGEAESLNDSVQAPLEVDADAGQAVTTVQAGRRVSGKRTGGIEAL